MPHDTFHILCFFQSGLAQCYAEIAQSAHLHLVAGLKSKFVGASGDQVTVEQLALEYYATLEGGGWQGGRWQA